MTAKARISRGRVVGPILIAGLALVAAVAAIALVVLRLTLPGTGASAEATFEEGGVRVDVRHVPSSGTVEATFTPLRDGFHLYGPDLPRDGIDGAGRPTLLELTPGGVWRANGPVTSEPATTRESIPTFEEPFSVFPAGPVTLRLSVSRTADAGAGELRVSVTYMACSDEGLCLAPIEGRVVSLEPDG